MGVYFYDEWKVLEPVGSTTMEYNPFFYSIQIKTFSIVRLILYNR